MAEGFAPIIEANKAFTRTLGEATSGLRALQTVAQTAFPITAAGMANLVSVSSPATFLRLQQSFTSLSGVMGQVFEPIVSATAAAVRELATWVYNLDPAVKALIAGIAVGGVVVVTALGITTTAVIVLNVALTAFNTLTGGIVLVIGLAVTALVGAAAAAGGAAVAMGYLGDVTKTLQPIWEGLRQVFAGWSAVFQILQPEIRSLASLLGSFLGGVLARLAVLAADLSKKLEQTVVVAVTVARILRDHREALARGDFDVVGEISKQLRHLENLRKGKMARGAEAPIFGKQASITSLEQAREQYQLASLNQGQKRPEEETAKNTGDTATTMKGVIAYLEWMKQNLNHLGLGLK